MKISDKKIISNSAILIGAEIFRKAIRMALVIFSARLLGDECYGKFSFAIAFTTLFWIFADMGIHQLLIRELARDIDKVKKYLGNTLAIKLFLSVLNLFLIYIFINFTDKSYEVIITVYILAVSLIVGSFIELFKAVFQAFQQMKYDAIATMVETVFITILGIGILFLGGNIRELAFAYLTGSLLSLGYCTLVIVKRFTALSVSMDMVLVKYLFREGLPIGINHFFSTMYTNVDSLMLSLMISDQVVGWYNASYRLVLSIQFCGMGIMKAVFPALSKYYKESMEEFTRLYRKTFKIMLIIGVSLASLISLLSDKIILLIYGEEYANAAIALQILICSMAVMFIAIVLTYASRSADRQRFTAKVVGFSALLNLALNFFLIPRYSYVGAAFATLAAQGTTFIFHYIYLSHNLVKLPILKLMLKVAVINLVMGIYIIYFRQANLFLLGFTAILVNLGMIWVTQYFTQTELALLKKLLKISKS